MAVHLVGGGATSLEFQFKNGSKLNAGLIYIFLWFRYRRLELNAEQRLSSKSNFV